MYYFVYEKIYSDNSNPGIVDIRDGSCTATCGCRGGYGLKCVVDG